MKMISGFKVFAAWPCRIPHSSATACLVLSLTLAAAFPAQASRILVDADSFSEGQALTDAFSGLTLTMGGRSDVAVIARDGYSAFNGTNIATTGSNVFGYTPVGSPVGDGRVWNEGEYGLFRVDFDSLVSFVQIDLLFRDDDVAALWAYDSSGNLLGSMSASGDGRGPVTSASVSISRGSADIAYVLAGGVGSEGAFLDNLQYQVTPVPLPAAAWLFISALGGLFGLDRWRQGRQSSVAV